MTSRTLFATLALVAFVGCATVSQKRADAAYERGDYVSAVEYYDRAVSEKPTSQKLITRRWEARARAVSELAQRADGLRRAGKTAPALAMARAAIDARTAWFTAQDAARLPANMARELDTLASWAATEASKGVRAELEGARPLAARAALSQGRPLFDAARLRARADEFATEISAAGKARCGELTARLPAAAAHLAHWVASYCRAFAAPEPPVPPSPEQVAALKIQNDTLAVTSAAQRERLERRIEELLVASPWFHAQAPELAAARIAGLQAVSYSTQRAQREVHWVENVPYQAQESYQESYTETEHYTTQEPYTEYRSESYSCGYGTSARTCTRSVPTTRYRTAYKTRPVTKHRTKYRTVTRHRAEPRIFRHEVVEHRGRYEAAWDVSLTFPAGTPELKIPAQAKDERTSDQHDVSFAPANVHPVKARLASADDWFDERLEAFTKELRERARGHWVWSFCGVDVTSPESAARCARGALEQAPAQVQAALSVFLGDDARLLLAPE